VAAAPDPSAILSGALQLMACFLTSVCAADLFPNEKLVVLWFIMSPLKLIDPVGFT